MTTLLLITSSPHSHQGLARGITDVDNANRHSLDGDNLRAPFRLVGLSELALQIDDDVTVIQF